MGYSSIRFCLMMAGTIPVFVEFRFRLPGRIHPSGSCRQKYGAAPGIWLSPWGGYDKAKEERMKYGEKAGI